MSREFEQLWAFAPTEPPAFSGRKIAGLPEGARRYLGHAIAEGTPLASAVRLKMHGEIRLRRWLPFTAEEVISWKRGMIWRATARLYGLRITGFDRIVDRQGAMRWRLLRIIPLVTALGPDMSRSTAGRLAAEAVWLPSVLCRDGVRWTSIDATHAEASFTAQGYETAVTIAIGSSGRLMSVRLKRWGNPEGGTFGLFDFGGIVEEERTFGGYTIPTRLRVGWHFGSPEFEPKGEFLRVMIDEAVYR
jgi:hypothetical protein